MKRANILLMTAQQRCDAEDCCCGVGCSSNTQAPDLLGVVVYIVAVGLAVLAAASIAGVFP